MPEIWLAPADGMTERDAEAKEWIRTRYQAGAAVYSACSGSVRRASTGLLDGREATSHWGYSDLLRERFSKGALSARAQSRDRRPGRKARHCKWDDLSWHDLAIHIIARQCSPGEALRIAKVYLLKWHDEGQLPYTSLVRCQPHLDAAVRRAAEWLAAHFAVDAAVAGPVDASGIAEPTLKRRFKAATGVSLIEYVQILRIEAAKRLLEQNATPIDEIAAEVGYDNAAFMRRLFKRTTGLKPARIHGKAVSLKELGWSDESPPPQCHKLPR